MVVRFRSLIGLAVFCLLGVGLAGVFSASPEERPPYGPALLDFVVSDAMAKQICDQSTCVPGDERTQPEFCLRSDGGTTHTRCKRTGNGCKTKPC